MHLQLAIPEEHVSAEVLDAGLEALTRLDESMLTEGRVPTFHEGVKQGVRWKPEPPGAERFDHAGVVLGRKWGDCDDLAPWRAASMRHTGEDPEAIARVVRSGPHRWHAVVQRGDGSFEDPSREAGMGHKVLGASPAVCPPMFPPSHAVVGDDLKSLLRPTIALAPGRGGHWGARADIPWSDTDYAMAAFRTSPVASTALVGAIMGACVVGERAGFAEPEHLDRLMAIAGLLEGHSPYDVAEACGEEAVVGAQQFISCAGDMFGDVMRVVTPAGLFEAAAKVMRHPSAPPEHKAVAAEVAKHAQGKEFTKGSIADLAYQHMRNQLVRAGKAPPRPNSSEDLALKTTAHFAADRYDKTRRAGVQGSDGHEYVSVEGFFDDIGDAIKSVAPIVSKAAQFIPGVGPAISSAIDIGAKFIPSKAPARPAAAPPPPPAAAPPPPMVYAPPPHAAPAAAPMGRGAARAAARAAAQVPPVHVHMQQPSAPGTASVAPVNVTAQPGGPVVIRF
jgi:hypothetical protein